MKDPAVLFYTQDFLTGTLLMSDEQKGKYITLLCLQHQNGKLSERDMLKICGAFDEDIWNKFIEQEGYFYNRRMLLETEKRNNYTESRRNNLSKKSKHMDEHMEQHMNSHMENENENEDININEEENKKKKIKKFIIPTIEEVEVYFGENGYSMEAAHKAFNYYSLADWYDSKGNKVRNWKQKMQAVWFKDENRIKPEKKRVDGYYD